MKIVRTIFTALCFSYAVLSSFSADYFVALTGDDSNVGSENLPWRTIQKAATTMIAGDRVTVASGNYDERISTVRGGTGETNRIVFKAEGMVTMRGFLVNHPFITIQGFRISGHSAPSVLRGYVEVSSGGDNFHLLNCNVEDGIYIVRPDLTFEAASSTIRSPSGGFLAAGFKPGQTLNIERATNTFTLLNSGTRVIQSR